MEQLYVDSGPAWRDWLSANHEKTEEIWLVFYKKESGNPTIDYETAVEEALCFGWIDSLIKRIDQDRYARKFTPRKDISKWSDSNKKRVAKVVAEGRMTKYGQAKVNIAKKNGCWDKPDRPMVSLEFPPELKVGLDANSKANTFFLSLPKREQDQFKIWINMAKKNETRQRRIEESLEHLKNGQGLGLK